MKCQTLSIFHIQYPRAVRYCTHHTTQYPRHVGYHKYYPVQYSRAVRYHKLFYERLCMKYLKFDYNWANVICKTNHTVNILIINL